jgi:hypothetical protein
MTHVGHGVLARMGQLVTFARQRWQIGLPSDRTADIFHHHGKIEGTK